MPTYEYLCEKCGHQFDLIQSIKAEPISVCPQDKCTQKRWGKGRVKKQINAGAGLIFKGTGFYITDYRSEGYKAAAKKDSGGESKPASTESKPAASESKPAAKAETKPAKPSSK